MGNSKEPPTYLVGSQEVEVTFLSKRKAIVDQKEIVGDNRQDLLLKIGGILQQEYGVAPMAVMGLYDVVDLR